MILVWFGLFGISYRIRINIKFILAKRLTEKDKKTIINSFTKGKTINELAKEFGCTKLTIIRNIKKNLGEIKYKELIIQSKKNSPFRLRN